MRHENAREAVRGWRGCTRSWAPAGGTSPSSTCPPGMERRADPRARFPAASPLPCRPTPADGLGPTNTAGSAADPRTRWAQLRRCSPSCRTSSGCWSGRRPARPADLRRRGAAPPGPGPGDPHPAADVAEHVLAHGVPCPRRTRCAPRRVPRDARTHPRDPGRGRQGAAARVRERRLTSPRGVPGRPTRLLRDGLVVGLELDGVQRARGSLGLPPDRASAASSSAWHARGRRGARLTVGRQSRLRLMVRFYRSRCPCARADHPLVYASRRGAKRFTPCCTLEALHYGRGGRRATSAAGSGTAAGTPPRLHEGAADVRPLARRPQRRSGSRRQPPPVPSWPPHSSPSPRRNPPAPPPRPPTRGGTSRSSVAGSCPGSSTTIRKGLVYARTDIGGATGSTGPPSGGSPCSTTSAGTLGPQRWSCPWPPTR